MTSAELKYLIAIDELYNGERGIKLTDCLTPLGAKAPTDFLSGLSVLCYFDQTISIPPKDAHAGPE